MSWAFGRCLVTPACWRRWDPSATPTTVSMMPGCPAGVWLLLSTRRGARHLPRPTITTMGSPDGGSSCGAPSTKLWSVASSAYPVRLITVQPVPSFRQIAVTTPPYDASSKPKPSVAAWRFPQTALRAPDPEGRSGTVSAAPLSGRPISGLISPGRPGSTWLALATRRPRASSWPLGLLQLGFLEDTSSPGGWKRP
jgi:hypothetical protein